MSRRLDGIPVVGGPGLCLLTAQFGDNTNATGTNAIVNVTPSKRQWWSSISKVATGVYAVTLPNAFISVVSTGADIIPTAGKANTALSTGKLGYADIPPAFMTTAASNANFAVDNTNTKLLILVYNSSNNALANIPANCALSFNVVLAQSSMNP